MKILLPEYGHYFRDNEGNLRISQYIYVEYGPPIIKLGIPSDMSLIVSLSTDHNIPTENQHRVAIYKQVEIPNNKGIARYELKVIEK